jgi:N-dimethylarginine dimethylaminohydrolase
MSVMRSARRQPEVRVVARQHESRGLHLEWLDAFEVPSFEAMGDSLWHPGRALLHAGVGPRSAPEAFRHVAAWTGVPVLLYEMKDPRFYHLDTCLSLLDERTAAAYLPAFTDDGKALLRQVFERVVEVDDREAAEQMFCNGHCPDGRHFLVQAGCPNGCAALRELGFEPLELETSEYLKSGGSVFCLKLHYWA